MDVRDPGDGCNHPGAWTTLVEADMPDAICTAPDCHKPADGSRQGWCSMHRSRMARNNSFEVRKRQATLTARFEAKVRRSASESACWEWLGAHTAGGYGTFTVPGRQVLAHRYSYEQHIGPIPDGLHIDHLCRNRACVNPRHLEPVPMAVNTSRGVAPTAINARLTSCRRGHPFDEQNTRIEGDGSRRCLTCKRANRKR